MFVVFKWFPKVQIYNIFLKRSVFSLIKSQNRPSKKGCPSGC